MYLVFGRNSESGEVFLEVTSKSLSKAVKAADILSEKPIISSAWVENSKIEDAEESIVHYTQRRKAR